MPELATLLLKHGADPNARIGTGLPAYDYPPYARVDANSGNIPRLRQPGATPLFLAAAALKVDLMRSLLQAGANPAIATLEGTTPLMAAAGLGRYEDYATVEEERALAAIRLLVNANVDVNQVNNHGETALHAAAHRGANSLVRFLVSNGADLEMKDKYGRTPLVIAQGDPQRMADPKDKRLRRTRGHQSTADLLLELGASPVPTASKPRL
jgi:ankyrin repeat protein